MTRLTYELENRVRIFGECVGDFMNKPDRCVCPPLRRTRQTTRRGETNTIAQHRTTKTKPINHRYHRGGHLLSRRPSHGLGDRDHTQHHGAA